MLAGWYARRMGTPIERFIIGSNRNDILTRWVDDGALVTDEVVPTLSPSMDIQVSSNLERLLFELLDRDGNRTAELMIRFRELGSVEAPRDPVFAAARLDDDETSRRHPRHVGCATAISSIRTRLSPSAPPQRRRRDPAEPVVCLSTAHPAKFPDAVAQATGVEPPVPERLAAALEGEEHYDLVGNDLVAVEAAVRASVGA